MTVTKMKPWPKKTPWTVIVTGYKQRRCGRWFFFDKHKRWNLVFEGKRVRDIRKTRYAYSGVNAKYYKLNEFKCAKEILPKEYWRYL